MYFCDIPSISDKNWVFVCDIAYICDIHVLESWANQEIQKSFQSCFWEYALYHRVGLWCLKRENCSQRGGSEQERGRELFWEGVASGNYKKRRENILWKICFLDKRMPSGNVDTNLEEKCLMGGLSLFPPAPKYPKYLGIITDPKQRHFSLFCLEENSRSQELVGCSSIEL